LDKFEVKRSNVSECTWWNTEYIFESCDKRACLRDFITRSPVQEFPFRLQQFSYETSGLTSQAKSNGVHVLELFVVIEDRDQKLCYTFCNDWQILKSDGVTVQWRCYGVIIDCDYVILGLWEISWKKIFRLIVECSSVTTNV